MKIIRMQIANEALAFYNVGSREYSTHMPALTSNPQENFYKILPAIVNLAFSIELFLKSFLEDAVGRKSRHNLKALFESWDNSEKELIMSMMLSRMSPYDSDFSETKFWDYMERNKFAFEDWRYYYQRGGQVNIAFLFVFATALNDFTMKLKEAGF